ncbi:TatD family hydrolase [Pelagicoccus albus]|uniref:TatD family hydrolase n=1 Tax=Pelagicoccus albus TaxID=415222 RepID=A0A7X1B4S5_9BACT|nr:TatD family hydrolase [Pelagicoccus albus]MBC2605648.1 TatD family hydrolase [Pelagicoccus albus]
MEFYDAHCHLQDARLEPHLDDLQKRYNRFGVGGAVVNGTGEGDWHQVARLCQRYSFLKPSFGLHPWRVNEASGRWKESMLERLDQFPQAGVGEIGLDRWIQGYDLEKQEEAFVWQLRIAAERNLPVSIHCLKAWGWMLEVLQRVELPSRGFLLHSYGGSSEMVEAFADLGAYFSVSAYFAFERKAKQRDAFRKVPLDRLLIETDAPDMKGPDQYVSETLEADITLNSPLNIVGVYEFSADLLEVPLEDLKQKVGTNYCRFFGIKMGPTEL